LSAYEKLSELYKSQGLEAEAVSQLDNLFKMYEKKNDEDKQLEVLKLMGEMDSENLGVQVRLGETLAKRGNQQEAAEAFAKAAATLSRRGLHDRASALFEKITSLDPENIAVRKELCSHYLETGQFSEARIEIEAILDIEPDDPRMVLLLGRILFQMGHKKDGEEKLARSIDLFTENQEIESVMREFLFVAQTHLKNGELDEAEAFYRQIEKASEGEIRAIKGLISVADERKDRANQVKYLSLLGRTLAETEPQSAAEAYARVLELDPANEEATNFRPAAPPETEIQDDEELLLEDDLEEVDTELPGEIDELDEIDEIEDLGEVADDEIILEMGQEEDIVEVIEEPEEDILEVSEEALLEIETELPDIVIEGVDEPSPRPVEEVPPDSPVEITEQTLDELSVDELLAEAEVYQRYELADNALEILNRAFALNPSNLNVLEKITEFHVSQGSMEAAVTGRMLVEGLIESGNEEGAAEVYNKLVGSMDDASTIADLEERLQLPDLAEVQVSSETAVIPEEISEFEESGVVVDSTDIDAASADLEDTFEIDPGEDEIIDTVLTGEDTVIEAEIAEEMSFEPDEIPGLELPDETHIDQEEVDQFSEELEEAEFYLSQGLEEEAVRIYGSILERSPDHAEAKMALDRLGDADPAHVEEVEMVDMDVAPIADSPGVVDDAIDAQDSTEFRSKLTVEDSIPEDVGGFLDLADELRKELAEEIELPEEVPAAEGPVTFEEVFAEFKKGIAETLGEGEYETHYNLGIAYKDMGLYDDAIKEFEMGARDPGLAQDSLSLMAMCFTEKKDFDSAVKTLGVALETANEENRIGLNYQLGEVQERTKDYQAAYASYESVKALDPTFEGLDAAIERISGFLVAGAPDVDIGVPLEGDLDDMLTDLIKEVEEMAMESESGDEDEPPPAGTRKKDRISYL